MAKPAATSKATFSRFDPAKGAEFSVRYLSGMTDPKLGGLPYWFVEASQVPPFAEHSRVDDALLVPLWYSGLSCAREFLGNPKLGADAQKSLKSLFLDPAAWGKDGLRYGLKHPWVDKEFTLLHEQAAALLALNRMMSEPRPDKSVDKVAAKLVAGLRKHAMRHGERVHWSGAEKAREIRYLYASDACARGKSVTPSFSSGAADMAMNNSVLALPLADRYELTGDKDALDLAVGLVNYVCGPGRKFSARMEFMGPTRPFLAFAAGLLKVGRCLKDDSYVARGKAIYDYVRRNSTAFGFVPERVAWQPASEVRCEACCTSLMILCGVELVKSGFQEYLDDVHRFWRNHLTESQICDTSFVDDPEKPPKDTAIRTYSRIGARCAGAMCGRSSPNSIDMGDFFSIAGCCSGSAPIAALAAAGVAYEVRRDMIVINFPMPLKCPYGTIDDGYPNDGYVSFTARKACEVAFRTYPWMSQSVEGRVNGHPVAWERHDDLIFFPKCAAGDVLSIHHDMRTNRIIESAAGQEWFGLWRGPDVVDLLPHGDRYRLYCREEGAKYDRSNVTSKAESSNVVTEEENPPLFRDVKLNRRITPRG